MEELFREAAATIALVLEAIAVLLIALGSAQALLGVARMLAAASGQQAGRLVFLGLARWLLLALEFTLAADLVRTTISPSWHEIGQLAAIALIRTFLNYFLERDLAKASTARVHTATAHAERD